LRTVTGDLVDPTDVIETSRVKNLVVDDFVQREFDDPVTGDTLKYNLYVPEDRNAVSSYPLVLFMHDAGMSSDDPLTTLKQGLGAIAFAQPGSQSHHPCLVLAPQFSSVVVNDASEATSLLETTVHLVQEITREFGVDTSRVYTTGQSGGAMMSMAIDIKYPELFAASFIVAGQWGPEHVAPLAGQALWILVAEGDAKAFPGQNAITDVLEEHGAVITRATWDGRADSETLGAAASTVAAAGTRVNYTVLRKGTVVPDGQVDDPLNNHINTWRIAYCIEPIRDWLFAQHR
jgi:predicted peptidase